MSRVRAAGRMLVVAAGLSVPVTASGTAEPLVPFAVDGDAIAMPLGGLEGDAARGRRLVLDRARGNCLICHQVSVPGEAFQGDLAPSLDGVGARLSAAAIRLRMVDQSRLNPATMMPSFYRIEGLNRVAVRYRGAPVLTAQEIEDVVAWLATLKN